VSKIRILSEHLANQIAAGEVIERPASVVKEFIENSIDAQAQNVSVQVVGDGTRLIRVIDDGTGMDQDDVLLCLERHATSKLDESLPGYHQLAGIRTLGFRGEAIPSIASVAKLIITSRPATSQLGTRVEVRFGKVVKAHESGCRQGTIMEVMDLFGNLPARKKFLKTSRTELSHIEEIIKSYCLASPNIGFSYTVNSNTLFNLPAQADTLQDRVKWIMGCGPAEPLIHVTSKAVPENQTFSAQQDQIEIFGYLLPPDKSGGPAARLRTFVNDRAVRDRMMIHAIKEGLAGFLMKGHMPAGAVFVTLPPQAVDVNVHPAKLEVRFHKPNAVHQLMALAVRHAVIKYQGDLKFSLFGSPPISSDFREKEARQKDPVKASPAHFASETSPAAAMSYESNGNREQKSSRKEISSRSCITENSASSHFSEAPVIGEYQPQERPRNFEIREEADLRYAGDSSKLLDWPGIRSMNGPHQVGLCQDDVSELVPIGQLMGLYVLCESTNGKDRSLVVIDQHAAHERLLFETLKKQLATKRITRQPLLFPEIIEFNLDQIEILKKYGEEIEKLGIDIEEFGDESYALKAVPALLVHLAPQEIMASVVKQFAAHLEGGNSGSSKNMTARIDEILSSLACRAAVKAGRTLEPEEINELLKNMREADVFSHCPHGRPVFKVFAAEQIKKWFHRT